MNFVPQISLAAVAPSFVSPRTLAAEARSFVPPKNMLAVGEVVRIGRNQLFDAGVVNGSIGTRRLAGALRMEVQEDHRMEVQEDHEAVLQSSNVGPQMIVVVPSPSTLFTMGIPYVAVSRVHLDFDYSEMPEIKVHEHSISEASKIITLTLITSNNVSKSIKYILDPNLLLKLYINLDLHTN